MTVITLTAYASVNLNANDKNIIFRNIPVNRQVVLPKRGLTLLYGTKSTLRHLSFESQRARAAEGYNFYKANVEVDVQRNGVGRQGHQDLGEATVLDLRMCKRDLKEDLCLILSNYLSEQDVSNGRLEELWGKPSLLDKLILHPNFNHLAVIIYNAINEEDRQISVATIFKQKVVKKIIAKVAVADGYQVSLLFNQ